MTLGATGEYVFEGMSEFGCDSVTTLDFTLLEATTSVTDTLGCDELEWNGVLYEEDGPIRMARHQRGGLRQHGAVELDH